MSAFSVDLGWQSMSLMSGVDVSTDEWRRYHFSLQTSSANWRFDDVIDNIT